MNVTDSAAASGPKTIVIRTAVFSARIAVRSVVVSVALVLLIVLAGAWALMTGDVSLSLPEVWQALINHRDAGFARTVVVQWRLPRALAAVVFGLALGAAGAVFQGLTRNPLASPDIIGLTSGSYAGALVAIVVIGNASSLMITAGAVIGGVATAAVVYLLAWRRGVKGFRLIIVGIGVSSMLGSVNTWLVLRADLEVAVSAASWGAGTLAGVFWSRVLIASAIIAVLLVALTALTPSLGRLALGDDAATALGTRVEPARLALVACGVALTATVTAVSGPIAFVALCAPQIARRLNGAPGVPVGAAALSGAALLLVADQIAQALPRPLPVGVITTVIGGSYLIWLLSNEVRRRVE